MLPLARRCSRNILTRCYAEHRLRPHRIQAYARTLKRAEDYLSDANERTLYALNQLVNAERV